MNWKLRLSLVVVVVLIAVIWIKFPSQADNKAESSPNEDKISAQQDKITKYENGVSRILPQNFAVSIPMRDMPKSDSDALVKRATFAGAEEIREVRKEKKNSETSFFGLDEDAEELNEINAERIRPTVAGAGLGFSAFEDPLLKKTSKLYSPESPQTMPTPSLTFNGASAVDNAAQGYNGLLPPDVNGDVGPNHYVSSVNLVLKIFNKNGGVVAGPIRTSSLFASLPVGDVCRTQNDGDPIVVYDSLADRWHISQFGTPDGANVNYQCVALSKTGDPTGEYYVWSYVYPLQGFNDYPKVGVWTDGYHMTFNQFDLGGNVQLGLGILTQDRKKALAGDPTAGAVYTNIGDFDQMSGGALPGDIDGYVAPPVGLAEVIGEYRATESGDPVDGVRMYRWIPNFDNPANSTLTVLGDVALTEFDGRQPRTRAQIEQLGGANLDAVADRSMHRFAYRNFGTTENPVNSYVGNFSVNVSGVNPTTAATYQTGIRWFEMRRSGDSFSVFDQGTHNLAPGDGANGLNNWMGSIAQDNRGDIALGFSQAGTNQRADIKIAGRTNNAQNSGTLNEGEALMHAATGSQIAGSSQPGNRWGDYSAMNVDPTDDCTFWYTQEYYATTSSTGWSTRVGKFRFPQCTDVPKATVQGAVTNCATGAIISGASINSTNGFNRLSGAGGTYSLIASPGTYSFSASRFGFLSSDSQSVTVGAGQSQTANFCLVPISAVSTSANPQIVSESCGISNGSPDPGEKITVTLPLQNNGGAATNNLTATLQSGNGVTASSGTQSFGAVAANGGSVSRNFTFTVDPSLSCGSTIKLTFNVNDGTTNFGTVTKTYTTGVRILTFSENFDSVTPPALPNGWTNVQLFGSAINWVTEVTPPPPGNLPPASAPNNVFASDPATKSTTALVSPAVQVQSADAQLSFKNFYSTELTFDGMVFEFSTDNGATWRDIIAGGGSFAANGYNSFIDSSTDSTLAGRLAWSGTDGYYTTTIVNLPASLNNQTVKFRWVMASDASVAGLGIRIDDIQFFGARQCNSGCSSTPDFCQFRNRFQFDNDARADISVFRPENGVWYMLNSQTGFSAVQFGSQNDKIVPADYDGDGKTDIAVYRAGTWYLQRSSAGFASIPFGLPDDVPQPADFDGDCKADIAVWRPSNGTWYVLNLTNNAVNAVQFGISTDKPVVSDYDGDGKADYAVYRPEGGNWYIQRSRDGFAAVQFGIPTDKPVVGDYDGDGKADEAVYRPESGNWYILRSRDGFTAIQFGTPTDLPAPADYDGDGKTDVGVYRPSVGTWYQQKSTEGFGSVQFGISTDKPVPNAYVP